MAAVQAKKRFGQHFLKEKDIARRIAGSLTGFGSTFDQVLEIGPGQGVMTDFLLETYGSNLHLVEIDRDLVPALHKKYPAISNQIYQEDFLKLDLGTLFTEPVAIVGNFPYNISSQILFKAVAHKALVPELVGMFQREVAQRVASPSGNKIYGMLSVWVQSYYTTEYLFTVSEGCFNPPPKVKSGVIRLIRRPAPEQPWQDARLLQIIKLAFGQRRKTLRNALRPLAEHYPLWPADVLDKRAEQLSPEQFQELARRLAHIPLNTPPAITDHELD